MTPSDAVRRFYAKVDCAPADGGTAVRLDGRIPRSPAGRPLVLPTPALAALIAEEWAGQGEHILLPTMPATRLAWTTLDRVPGARQEVAAEIAKFAATDLLCYFADGPVELVDRQDRRWGPVVAWAEDAMGLEFRRIVGIIHAPQPEATVRKVAALAAAEDDFALAGLAFATALLGSAILAFALQRGALSAEAAFELSRLDETFQEERWGIDAEAAARSEVMARDTVTVERWFRALRDAS